MIDTVPLPEKTMSVRVPASLLKEFKEDVRFVVKDHLIWGIPVPEFFIQNLAKNKELFDDVSERFDIMLIPR